jgi:uncharacterized membrane protein
MIDPATLLAILAMAAATYATRIGGLLVAAWVPGTGRARAALEALPAAVLTAVIAPTALVTGLPETSATLAAIAAAAARLPILVVVAIGVVVAAALRWGLA